MKRYLLLIALLPLVGCAGPLGLQRMFPDGASVKILKPVLTISMSGAGNLSADEISWVGTNGYPIPSGGTNSVTTATPINGLLLK